ncbi:glycosyltransferase [Nonomuraea sp. NPDC047897]|uniref:glycosyltransferase n=1 Tax=Nonomuraea sp. NPDC047897 TaxID=3364346 RepID=UPI0037195CD3
MHPVFPPGAAAGPPPLRVLIGTDTYPPEPGGSAPSVRALAHELAARGHDVHVVCRSGHGPPRAARDGDVMVYRLRSVPLPGFGRICLPPLLAGPLRRLVERIAPDVAHVHGAFAVARAVLGAARELGVPVVTRPVETLPGGVDLSRFRPPEEPRSRARALLGLPDRLTVLSVGRLDARGRQEDLIRALPHVCRRLDVQAVVAGCGPRRARLERLARRCGLTGRVHLPGPVPEDTLPLVYAAADVFAVPGAAGAGSAATLEALEALATGLPVVSAGSGALDRLVLPGATGYLYAPGDVRALAGRLARVLAEETPDAMGAVCRAVAATHDRVRTVTRFEEIYASLARARRRPLRDLRTSCPPPAPGTPAPARRSGGPW